MLKQTPYPRRLPGFSDSAFALLRFAIADAVLEPGVLLTLPLISRLGRLRVGKQLARVDDWQIETKSLAGCFVRLWDSGRHANLNVWTLMIQLR